MKLRVLALTCILLAGTVIHPNAEGEIDTAGIEFDFNQDGVTDRDDWEELSAWVKAYKMEDDDRDYFAKQEVPATIGLLINEYYGNRQEEDYGIEVASVPEYYLPSLGDSTVVKDQGSFGSCWAFGAMSSIESNLLRQRNGTAGTIAAGASKLNVSKASDEVDLSEFYHAYMNMVQEEDGSQKGEGVAPVKLDEPNIQFMFGGFGGASQKLLTSWTGPLTEKEEPYEPLRAEEDGVNIYGLRHPEEDKTAVPAAHIQEFVYLDTPNLIHVDLEEEQYVAEDYDAEAIGLIKQGLVKYGALMLSYGTDVSMPTDTGSGEYFNYSNWAQYYDAEYMKLNHMVSIVGWDDNYPKENFQADINSLPEGDGAFLIKNSWGSYDTNHKLYGDRLDEQLEIVKGTENEYIINRRFNYGIQDQDGKGSGYFWLSYYDKSMVGICALNADDGQDGFDYDNIYQYDLASQITIDPVSLPTDNTETKVANIFTAENDEELAAVSVYAPAAGAEAEIRIISVNKEDADLSSGVILAEMEVSFTEKGFHTVDLDSPVTLNKGDTFAVIERVVTEHEGKKTAWLNLENIVKPSLQTDDNIGECRMKAVSNPGESFAYVKTADGYAWTDIKTLNKETDAAEVFEFGNAFIKAYTKNAEEAAPVQTSEGPTPTQKAVGWSIIAVCLVYFIIRKSRPAKA